MPDIPAEEYSRLMRQAAGYGQLKTQYKQLRTQHDELQGKHTKLSGDFEGLTTENGKLKESATAAPTADERVAKLTEENRTLKHRTAFEKLARGKLRDEALDDAWSLSGYKPESDEVDEAAIGKLIDDQVARRPYLAPPAAEGSATATAPKPGAPTKTTPTTPITPAEGAGRGGAANQAALDARTAVDAKYAATGRSSAVPGRI